MSVQVALAEPHGAPTQASTSTHAPPSSAQPEAQAVQFTAPAASQVCAAQPGMTAHSWQVSPLSQVLAGQSQVWSSPTTVQVPTPHRFVGSAKAPRGKGAPQLALSGQPVKASELA